MTKKHIAQIVVATIIVAIIHALTPPQYFALHVLFRLLYFLPIVIAALTGGRKIGFITSLSVSLLFLPHLFFHHASSEFIAGNVAAIILFNLCGFFIGSFRESSENNLAKRLQQEQVAASTRHNERLRVLFYIDGSPLSLSAANWFRSRYNLTGISVVLLKVISHDRDELIADKLGRQLQERNQALDQSLVEIRQVLVDGGMTEENIETITEEITEKLPISDRIVEYAGKHEFDWILLCKHNKSKSEEFLFGDTAIQVLRKTSTPMLIVKGSGEEVVLA